ncbi:MAG: threonine synthase [Planctomycetaceae bacterium]
MPPHDKSRKVTHRCLKCSRRFPQQFVPFCACGGMVEVEYDLRRAALVASNNSLERFSAILPVERRQLLHSQSLESTPCVHARRLGDQLGMPWLYLKNEAVLPTRTTKYRMAVVSLAYLAECGITAFCTSSTGNSSTAYAHAIAGFPDCRMYLFTAEAFRDRVDYGPSDRVVPFVLRDATFVDAFECAQAYAKRHRLTSEHGFFNPGRREGLKLAFLEATDQVPRTIDWYVQAVSSGMGVYGAYKGARELVEMKCIERVPRLLCVQQETCAPMVRAWNDGQETIRPEHIVHRPTGIAQAILRGNPTRAYPHLRRVVVESGGNFVAVTEQNIREARLMVEELEGISPCFSASAALAGVIRMVRQEMLSGRDTVVVNLTGGDRQPAASPQTVRWLKRSAQGWVPEIHEAETVPLFADNDPGGRIPAWRPISRAA